LYWRAGWEATPEREWRVKVQELIRGESWIIDGNYGGTLDLRLEACDTVFFLDLPRLTCLRRVMSRQLRHLGRERPEMPPGCPERLNLEFLLWIWTYPARRRGGILQRLGELSGKKEIVILRTPRAAEEYLSSRTGNQEA